MLGLTAPLSYKANRIFSLLGAIANTTLLYVPLAFQPAGFVAAVAPAIFVHDPALPVVDVHTPGTFVGAAEFCPEKAIYKRPVVVQTASVTIRLLAPPPEV